jgi:hypothetical protein
MVAVFSGYSPFGGCGYMSGCHWCCNMQKRRTERTKIRARINHKTNTFTVKENNVHATPAHGCFPTLLATYHPNRQPHYPHGKAGRQDKYTNHDYIFAFY